MSPNRDIERHKQEPIPKQIDRKNYLLVIGIDSYEYCADLYNAVDDAKAFVHVLLDHYQFDYNRLIELYNSEANQSRIIEELRNCIDWVGEDDNLIIYFSGHGHFDEQIGEAYWIPSDAAFEVDREYISYDFITRIIRSIPAHHIALIVDSCYSGAILTQERNVIQDGRVSKDPSRWILASGRNEVVQDGQMGKHSPFANQLLNVLRRYKDEGVRFGELVTRVTTATMHNAMQVPIGRPIFNVGDQGGEFVFLPKSQKKAKDNQPNKQEADTTLPSPRPSIKNWFQKHSNTIRIISVFGTYLIVSALSVVLLLRPKRSLPFQADIVAETVAFRSKGIAHFNGERKTDVSFQSFQEAILPITQFAITRGPENGNNTKTQAPWQTANQAKFLANKRSSAIYFSDVSLKKLNIDPGAVIQLSKPEYPSNANEFTLSIKDTTINECVLSYPVEDTLKFGGDHLSSFYNEDSIDWVGFHARSLSKPGFNDITVRGKPNIFNISFIAMNEVPYNHSIFSIDSASFVRKDREAKGGIRSTIQRASISFLHQNEKIDSVHIVPGNFLYIRPNEALQIDRLNIGPRSISIRISGQAESICVDNCKESQLNPSLFQWLYLTRKIEIGFIILILTGLLRILPRRYRQLALVIWRQKPSSKYRN